MLTGVRRTAKGIELARDRPRSDSNALVFSR
jgi:hypothetical protein